MTNARRRLQRLEAAEGVNSGQEDREFAAKLFDLGPDELRALAAEYFDRLGDPAEWDDFGELPNDERANVLTEYALYLSNKEAN